MPDNAPKILFLAAHVQPFLLAGVMRLVKDYNARVLVVANTVLDQSTADAFVQHNISFLVKDETNVADIEKHIIRFAPDVVWAAGWMDKQYLKWAGAFKKSGQPTIMAMDTQWKGKLKQYINALIAPFFIQRIYSHCWVPGVLQLQYAKKLGFKDAHILNNLLIPDTDLFGAIYDRSKQSKKDNFPKALLYIGRLEPHKFENLLLAFTQLEEQHKNGWKLIVVGSGSMKDHSLMNAPGVIYKGFLDQPELAATIEESGIFCLTSKEEPWGTVIQEAAAAGMPVLVSKQCGAHFAMLEDGDNGLLCDGESVTDIKDKIKKMIALPVSELVAMGERSHKIGTATNPAMWAATLMSVIKNN